MDSEPCLGSPAAERPSGLELFLFFLLRDHLALGEVSRILRELQKVEVDNAGYVTYDCPYIPWLPEKARWLADRLSENEPRSAPPVVSQTFFTIGNVDDEIYPPNHPKVLRFFDRSSAEEMLAWCQGEGIPGSESWEVRKHGVTGALAQAA